MLITIKKNKLLLTIGQRLSAKILKKLETVNHIVKSIKMCLFFVIIKFNEIF